MTNLTDIDKLYATRNALRRAWHATLTIVGVSIVVLIGLFVIVVGAAYVLLTIGNLPI